VLRVELVLPNLIIIGAAKAGTTSLHHYLGQHPSISMAAPAGAAEKEMRYFWRDDWRERRAWYESHFETGALVRGEATPAYSAHPAHPHVPERMHALVPDAKLVYLVRDPIDRIVSHWVQRRADGDPTPFGAYVAECERPDNPVVCPSRYATQIEQYLRFYDRSQLLVLDQHDLRNRRRETLRQVFRFLDVDASFDSPAFDAERNTRADKVGPRQLTMRLWPILWPVSRAVPRRIRDSIREPATRLLNQRIEETPTLTIDMRKHLSATLAPEVQALRELTGRPFASWSL
jgi:hypothetical protein